MMTRAEKFRQSAFAYLLVGILYEGAAWAMWRRGILPAGRGPGWLWMLIGAAIVALVVWGLWKWQNVWFARVIWVIHALRVPTLIGHAFFPDADQKIVPAFYLTALVVVVANLWMLGRAAWDL
jgi:hypothetical protein